MPQSRQVLHWWIQAHLEAECWWLHQEARETKICKNSLMVSVEQSISVQNEHRCGHIEDTYWSHSWKISPVRINQMFPNQFIHVSLKSRPPNLESDGFVSHNKSMERFHLSSLELQLWHMAWELFQYSIYTHDIISYFILSLICENVWFNSIWTCLFQYINSILFNR